MSETRQSFVEHFGERNASAVEQAAGEHADEPDSTNKGSDSFRWAVAICIGYQCMEVDRYRGHHGITAPWPELKRWVKDHANLREHDGDVDWLSAIAGVYDEYVEARTA